MIDMHRRFYLGLDTNLFAQTSVPAFVSIRRLRRLKTWPKARGPWALDSGGFTELSMHGRWQTTPSQYVEEAQRTLAEVGWPDFVAPQDWMCEPWILAKTGLTVRDHQRHTIDNYLTLVGLAPEVPWVPVLQGWELADYESHIDQYRRAGVDLTECRLVGLGSVCRREATAEIETIVATLHHHSIRLHGFGIKTSGLKSYGVWLTSADSMSWSYNARRNPPLPGHRHRNCNNCLPWALQWRQRIVGRPMQSRLGVIH